VVDIVNDSPWRTTMPMFGPLGTHVRTHVSIPAVRGRSGCAGPRACARARCAGGASRAFPSPAPPARSLLVEALDAPRVHELVRLPSDGC
jgi:hypothetical protein